MTNEENILTESISSHVGIFWWWNNQLISFMEPVNNLNPDSLGFVNPPVDHDAIWDKVVAAHPDLRGKEYFDVPRGRVVYNVKEQKFRLLSSKSILSQNFLVYRIAREFHVPPQKIIRVHDEHYEIPEG